MNYTIKNDRITAQISDKGAELMSVIKDGVEYIWQGDAKYWSGRAYNLFPTCGRMVEGKYTFEGKIYDLKIHGIVRYSMCAVIEHNEDSIIFLLESNEETKAIYPFDFKFYAEFALNGDCLTTRYTAVNTGNRDMYCTFGGHPGFNVPLDNGDFDDYYLEFSEECEPREAIFSDGSTADFQIRDKKFIDLKHSLFDNDSFFLVNAAPAITLKSKVSRRFVTVSYPQHKYIGVWHAPKTDAPYVCIEPWCGSPARAGGYSDLATMQDMYTLKPDTSKTISFDIIFG